MTQPTDTMEEELTIDWLIDRVVTQHSPLIDYNVKRLKALIATQVREARIDELENHMKQEWNGINQVLVSRRIQELKSQQKEKE